MRPVECPMQILNTFRIFCQYEPLMRERLGNSFRLLYASQEHQPEIFELLPETEVLISNRFTAEYAGPCRRLRLLHTPGAGLDKIDIAAIPPGVRLCQSFGHGPSIAEHVIMVTVALLRRLFLVDRSLRAGQWLAPQADPAEGLLEPLCGKTVVILGTGEIGAAVAEKCRAFDMHTVGVNRTARPVGQSFDEVHPLAELPSVLAKADVLVVAVPLDAGTRGLISAGELRVMKPTALLVNVARGPVVDEEALFCALSAGSLGGAAIDVWYDYPSPGSSFRLPSRFPFSELGNVIMTPHISGVAKTTFDRRVEDLLFNIESLAAGRPLRHEVRLGNRPT
jgi:phosphoglycerate dehydrogenase-like enzyme